MKKEIVCTICALLLLVGVVSCSTRDMVNDRRIEKLHAEIVALHNQIATLQVKLELQRVEIERLRKE